MTLDAIADKGEAQLDSCLEAEIDQEALYNRFAAYRPLAGAGPQGDHKRRCGILRDPKPCKNWEALPLIEKHLKAA
jgi:hypothetical protein